MRAILCFACFAAAALLALALHASASRADEAPKAVWIFISETLTIRPLGLAVNELLP